MGGPGAGRRRRGRSRRTRRPKNSRLGRLAARVQHWRTGLGDDDPAGGAQMGAHVADDGHQVDLKGP